MADKLQQPCGCEDTAVTEVNGASVGVLQELDECNRTVSELVCVEAEVTITPTVDTGDVTVRCVGNPSFTQRCRDLPGFTRAVNNTCRFRVSQVVCVSVPIEIGADANATLGDVFCGPRSNTANCPTTPPTACTFTRGAWANRQRTLGLQLLADAGGSIVLGNDAQGLSLTVTSANYDAVITGTVGPSPQFRQLYAQLLAANLNVLNGATCPFIEAQIIIANNFLATTTEANNTTNAAAAAIQTQLELFNSGEAPGCPMHCGDDDIG